MGVMTIKIGDRLVGEGHPVFFIAEAGVNHNGSVDLARKLVHLAAEARADGVKFQKRSVQDILIAEYLNRPYNVPTSLGATYGEHRQKLELSDDDYRQLSAACQREGIVFLASAWDQRSADFLEELGISAYKTASADLSNLPLLEHIARKGKPMLISTGMSDLSEVAEAVETVTKHNDQFVLLQCTSTYPADNDRLNLRVMETYRRTFDCLIGYSGHERGLAPSEAAAALGAVVIERHFTVDRTMTGPDHAASLEPEGLRKLIRNIRNIERALGSAEKTILDEERPVRARLAKSIVARMEIPAGTVIRADMLTVKGPGTGLRPNYLPLLVGLIAGETVAADTLVPHAALEWKRAQAAAAR
jgi:sialic acid synthase SpsE